MQELSSRESDIKNELKMAEVVCSKKRKAEVCLWLENVEKITSEVTKIEDDSKQAKRYLIPSHLALEKRVVKKIEEVVKLKEKGQFSEGLLADLLLENGSMPATKLMGRTTVERNILEQIWESLINQEVRTIGVYGLEGVGKTTIMTHIYNKIESSRVFDTAIWVTVSNDSNIERLQNGIAQAIGLELSNKEDEMIRSMMRREKFVIIFDDVWKSFPLEKVGIPEGNAYKIVLTTRFKNVCRSMQQEMIDMKALLKEEA
ncbi:probable disease resistance protein At1g15890 [Magnolia sinica]|uniref:probable disease resistance protein At1g15890 n=1 Tax=Magnolia sinica TaxID=86752 RepID=UPI00265948A4|nr:probable disease resistance protein At1g15890 [Magnolia sinica]